MQEATINSFDHFSLEKELQATLINQEFITPTDIQIRAIPSILAGKDIFAQAKTGSGKTGAFAIPIINNIITKKLKNNNTKGPFYLVLTPTRELTQQIEGVFQDFGSKINLKTLSVIGGEEYKQQKQKLEDGTDIVIATPGRLIDLYKQQSLDFKHIHGVVLDEADRLFDMGFRKDIRFILEKIPTKRQLLMFSATNHFDVLNMAYHFNSSPEEIALTSDDNITVDSISQSVIHVGDNEKVPLLVGILKNEVEPHCIIFCNTKSETHTISTWLQNINFGFNIKGISGKLPQEKRTRIVKNFKEKKINILVSTDVAARGLDIDNISLVINYDLPQDPSSYVHRIGRTGRAGLSGKAISFCGFHDCKNLELIEEFLNNKIMIQHIDESLLETNIGRRPITEAKVGNMKEVNGNLKQEPTHDNTNYNEKKNLNQNSRRRHSGSKDKSRRNNSRPRNTPIEVKPTKSRNNIEITSNNLQDAVSQAMEFLKVDDQKLLDHTVTDKGGKKLFGLLGSKETTYNFTVSTNQELLSRNFLDNLLKLAQLDLSYNVELTEKSLLIDFVGNDEELLTKSYFELLQSIEVCLKKYLAKRVVTFPGFIVRLSCNGISDAKQVKLEETAQKLKDRVLKDQKSYMFESLGPKDRRIIHQFFSEDNEVKTDSKGKGYYKKIQLSMK